MATVSANSERSASSQARSIVIAGLLIAVMGGFDQTTFAVLTQQATPVTFFQFIASALLGATAFAGGYTTALLGLIIHLVISFVVAGVFILPAGTIALVRRTFLLSAVAYGAAVSFISALLLPLTAAPKVPVSTLSVVHGLASGSLYIGLPLAMTIWQSAGTRKVSVPA